MVSVNVELVDKLSLFDNNLYQNGRILTFYNEGEQSLIRTPLNITPSEEDEWRPVRLDDTLDKIAWERYKDKVEDPSKWWWLIADANKIYNPFDLTAYVGKDFLIPDIYRIKLLLASTS